MYYASLTGRESDHLWYTLTPTEITRVIKATSLNIDDNLKVAHLISAFQELDRVYEFGIRSPYPVKGRIFNYTAHAKTSMDEQVTELIVSALIERDYHAFLYVDAVEILQAVCKSLDTYPSVFRRKALIIKYFQARGYEVRIDKHRVQYQGRKHPAIMQVGLKPRDIVSLDSVKAEIIKKVYGALR